MYISDKIKLCAYSRCTNSFPDTRRDRKFCSPSCRVMDCRDRKQGAPLLTGMSQESPATPGQSVQPLPVLEDLKLRASNQITAVGTIEAALGAAAVGFANYELVDKVTHQKLDARLIMS